MSLQDTLSSQNAGVSPADSAATDSAALKSGVKNTFRFRDEEEEEQEDTVRTEELPGPSVPLQGHGLFKNHSLEPRSPNAQPLNNPISDWFTISLIGLLAFFTWFRSLYYRIFRQLFTAFFNITTTNQIVRDESVLLQKASLILSVISYLVMGLFVYQVTIFTGYDISFLQGGLLRFMVISLVIALAYSGKMIILRFLSVVFDQEKAVALYIFNIFLMVMMSGLILLPVNFILAYTSPEIRMWTIWIAAGAIGLLFVYRLVRAIGIWTGIPGFPVFYLFLYFCTFEIAPLLIIWKVLAQ